MISGIVYVKMRNIIIKQKCFQSKVECKRFIEAFLKEFPNHDVIVSIDDKNI